MRTAAIFLCTALSCTPAEVPVTTKPETVMTVPRAPLQGISMSNVVLSNGVIIPGESKVVTDGDARIIHIEDAMNKIAYTARDSGYTVMMTAAEDGKISRYDAPAYTHICADGRQYFFLRGMLPDDCFPE